MTGLGVDAGAGGHGDPREGAGVPGGRAGVPDAGRGGGGRSGAGRDGSGRGGAGAPGVTGRARRSPGRAALPAAGAFLALSLAAFAVLCLVQGFPMADLLVYRAEGRAVLEGTDLYGFTTTEWDLPATYPPFAALLFVPLAVLPLGLLKVVFVLGNAALLACLVHQSLVLAGRGGASGAGGPARADDGPARADGRGGAGQDRTGADGARPGAAFRAPVVLAATGAALWLEPVFQTFVFGQINLALACLVLWDLTRPAGARGRGLVIGIAAGIKLTPAIFAVYLLVTGRVRAAFTAFAGFAGTVVLSALLLPRDSADFWARRLFETTRVGKAWIVDNQSLQGLVARAAHTAEPGALWVLPALGVALVCLAVTRLRFVRERAAAPLPGPGGSGGAPGATSGEVWGVLTTALVALLVSPISWSHHWVWCVPLLVVLAAGPAPRWVPGVLLAVFTARSMWLVPKAGDLDLHLPWWLQPAASPYPLLALLVLAWWALAMPRGRHVPGRAGPGDGTGPANGDGADGRRSGGGQGRDGDGRPPAARS